MPVYMRSRSPIHVPLHRVIEVLKTIDEQGHSKTFQKAAEEAGASVRIHADTVNFIKDFMANNMPADHAVVNDVVNSGGGITSPPKGCPYHQPG